MRGSVCTDLKVHRRVADRGKLVKAWEWAFWMGGTASAEASGDNDLGRLEGRSRVEEVRQDRKGFVGQ